MKHVIDDEMVERAFAEFRKLINRWGERECIKAVLNAAINPPDRRKCERRGPAKPCLTPNPMTEFIREGVEGRAPSGAAYGFSHAAAWDTAAKHQASPPEDIPVSDGMRVEGGALLQKLWLETSKTFHECATDLFRAMEAQRRKEEGEKHYHFRKPRREHRRKSDPK